jgi:hypothetical protein
MTKDDRCVEFGVTDHRVEVHMQVASTNPRGVNLHEHLPLSGWSWIGEVFNFEVTWTV